MDIEKKLKELLKSVVNLKVEQAFKIEIPDSAIDDGTFNSFDGILSVVTGALNEK